MGCVRNPDRRQLTGTVAARQFLRIAAVGLHPVSGFGWNQTGSNHLTGNSQLRQLPIQHVPGRAGFIAGPQMLHWSEFMNQLADRFQSIRNHPDRPDLPARFGNRHSDRFGMDIETNKQYFSLDMSDQFLSYAALRRWIHLFAA